MRLTRAFDRRLDAASVRPIAVAVSGGADSILALRLILDWARSCGRPVVALSVDHGLQADSAEWSAFAAAAALRLGAKAQILRWAGPAPASGLPAAARQARHGLLAQAARAAGAQVIVTGHTASDAAENAALGQGPLSEWSPSPVWPQGRGIFLLRPLLGLSRRQVRECLTGLGETWIDDPANEDLRHPRVRARRGLAGNPAPPLPTPPVSSLAWRAVFEAGRMRLPRAEAAAAPDLAGVLAIAATCAGGGQAIPRAARAARLAARIAAPGPVSATLAGARIEADAGYVTVFRNAGETARGGLTPLLVPSGQSAVWDGRYENLRQRAP